MLKEFKEFINRGSVMDMAVGVIIGTAFTAIVNSLVNDIIMPIIGKLIGNMNFTELFASLDGKTYATLALAEEAGAPVIKYGVFINTIINFLLIAFVIFMVVRSINKMHHKEEEAPAAPTTKVCPFCKTDIPIEATRCPHCTSELS